LLRASFQCNASFNRSSSPCYLRGAEQSASAICKVPACDQCMVLQGGALENSTAERSIAQFFCAAHKYFAFRKAHAEKPWCRRCR